MLNTLKRLFLFPIYFARTMRRMFIVHREEVSRRFLILVEHGEAGDSGCYKAWHQALQVLIELSEIEESNGAIHITVSGDSGLLEEVSDRLKEAGCRDQVISKRRITLSILKSDAELARKILNEVLVAELYRMSSPTTVFNEQNYLG